MNLERSTVHRILNERGIELAPLRGNADAPEDVPESALGRHRAADFFSVGVLTATGFVRYLVLFVIALKTRRIHIAGIAADADGGWMAQIARNLTDRAAAPRCEPSGS